MSLGMIGVVIVVGIVASIILLSYVNVNYRNKEQPRMSWLKEVLW